MFFINTLFSFAKCCRKLSNVESRYVKLFSIPVLFGITFSKTKTSCKEVDVQKAVSATVMGCCML